jgi:proline iminopeptidase
VNEAFVDVNGVRFWTARQGSGPPLVMLHGGPGLWDVFDGLAPLIDDAAEVHRYDQRGCGRSEDGPPYDIESFIADLDALRAHWRHERWLVGGHSWGATLALAYAVEHVDRTSALVLISGTGVVDDWHEEYHANADARLTSEQVARREELSDMLEQGVVDVAVDEEFCVLSWMSDFARPEGAMERARSFLRPWRPNYGLNAALNADGSRLLADGFADLVAALPIPVLVLHGADDPRPPRLAERLAATLPNARLVIMRGAGHLPWIERPDAVRESIGAFLREAAALGSAAR